MLRYCLTRQAVYVLRNIEKRSLNHCCRGRAISITYFERVCNLNYPACKAHASYCHLWPVEVRGQPYAPVALLPWNN
jgi:hypothetical protein